MQHRPPFTQLQFSSNCCSALEKAQRCGLSGEWEMSDHYSAGLVRRLERLAEELTTSCSCGA
eukprot:3284947-Amphidinium_carterae.1